MSGILKRQTGFTIVELLIVIVVIGILAAITIVAYNGVQNKATNASVQSDVSAFRKKIELVRTEASDGLYPAIPTSAMGFSFTKSAYATGRNNLYYCTSTDRSEYAFGVTSKTGDSYTISSKSGDISKPSANNDALTCGIVGRPNGSQMGLVWTTVDTWYSWTNVQ